MKIKLLYLLLLISLFVGCNKLQTNDFVYISENKIYSYDINKEKSEIISDKYKYISCEYSSSKNHIIFFINEGKSGFINTTTKEITIPQFNNKETYFLKINEKHSLYTLQTLEIQNKKEVRKIVLINLNNNKIIKEINGYNLFWHYNYDKFLYVNNESEEFIIFEMNVKENTINLIFDGAEEISIGLAEPRYFEDNIYFKIFGEDGIYFVKLKNDKSFELTNYAPPESNQDAYGISQENYQVSDNGNKLLLIERAVSWADLNKNFNKRIVLIYKNERKVIDEGDDYKWLQKSDYFIFKKENNIYLCNSNNLKIKLLLSNADF